VEEGEFTIVGSSEEEDEEESMMDQGWMETAESVDSDEEINAPKDVGDKEDDIEEESVRNTYPEDEGDSTVDNEGGDVEAEDWGMAIIVNENGGGGVNDESHGNIKKDGDKMIPMNDDDGDRVENGLDHY